MADGKTPDQFQTDSANAPADETLQGLSEESLDVLGLGEEQAPPPPQSEGLPEEYKPYSQFPWDKMDPETRQETLEKLKKFHGDMSRNSQEVAELRRTNAELQSKAEWLDSLANQPWFQEAYQAQMSGPTSTPPPSHEEPPSFNQLNEYGIEGDAAKVMDKAVDAKLQQMLGPLAQKLEFLERSIVQDQTNMTLRELTSYAKQNGYPLPASKMAQMREVIRSGRANNVRDAYMLAISGDVPNVVATKTRAQLQKELEQRQKKSIPPGRSASGTPSQDYSGPDGIQRALADARRELSSLQGGGP